MASETAASLPYHEPPIVSILIQSSFLLLLNVVNAVLDRLVYCGLLGQVLIGIAWGTPGAQWLSTHVEEVIVQLGYLGLILLVYEGGLSTSFPSLKANLLLSSAVAITGIAIPIALSFSLQGLVSATPLQAFAAGAALCSTSLGTTFTVLASSGLSSSRLGVVLTSAAMMDDVVGLVMVQVISNLGGGNISAVTVVRPVLVSFAFAIVVPITCRFIAKPATQFLNKYREAHSSGRLARLMLFPQTAFVIHTLLLITLVSGASYAGTSNLFAAYIAGAVISWWDSEVPHPVLPAGAAQANPTDTNISRPVPSSSGDGSAEKVAASIPTDGDHAGQEPELDGAARQTMVPQSSNEPTATTIQDHEMSGSAIYEHYYQKAVSRILQPFFFASIGFSIPITRMFNGQIVWRGIVYTVLMTFGKLVCGMWLIRFSLGPTKDAVRGALARVKLPSVPHLWGKSTKSAPPQTSDNSQTGQRPRQELTTSDPADSTSSHQSPSPPKPFSLHPPLILALAMTARGEIGFLISSVAEANGVFASSNHDASGGESDIFLIVTWAIVLCTILGPLGVGLCVRRVKALEDRKNREQEGTGRDVLGVWGIE